MVNVFLILRDGLISKQYLISYEAAEEGDGPRSLLCIVTVIVAMYSAEAEKQLSIPLQPLVILNYCQQISNLP